MKYQFSEEQYALGVSVDAYFGKTVTSTWQRELWDSSTGRDETFWAQLSALGLIAILLPEDHGGFDGSLTDLIPALEAAGRYAVPDALIESVLLAPAALAGAGSPVQRAEWLEAVATGELRTTVSLREGALVPDAHVADLILLRHGDCLQAYRSEDVELERVYSQDPARRLFTVRPYPGSGQPLPRSTEQMARLEAIELVATAAFINGICEHLLDTTVGYAKERQQFGRAVGSFMAVKHLLADGASRLWLSQIAARAAATELAGTEIPQHLEHSDHLRSPAHSALTGAVSARLVANDTQALVNHVALQVHGGIGFTFEHDLQFWLKRGKVLEQLHGGTAELAHRVGVAAIAEESAAEADEPPGRAQPE